MNRTLKHLLTFLFLVLCTGCGYHFGQGELTQQYQTISVPYVDGDLDGSLTAAIVREMSFSGAFDYCYEGGDLNLIVKIIEFRDQNIGFRYDVKKKDKHVDSPSLQLPEFKIVNSIIPVETRLTAIVEILLVDATSGDVIRGPVRISADAEFDHDYYENHRNVNTFSLGQLSDYDAAREAVLSPLNAVIARKICDYINNS